MIGGVTIWEIIWTGGLPHLPGVSYLHVRRSLRRVHSRLPGEQRFPSCMAFSIYEVVRVACITLSCGQFVYVRFLGERRFANDKSHAREKPLNFGTDEITSAIAEGTSRLGRPRYSPRNLEIQLSLERWYKHFSYKGVSSKHQSCLAGDYFSS